MYPTDIAKTRAQLSKTRVTMLGAVAARGAGVTGAETLGSIVRQDGLPGLYRGIASPILAEAPKRAIKFASNEQYKQLLMVSVHRSPIPSPPQGPEHRTLSAAESAAAGSMAGASECVPHAAQAYRHHGDVCQLPV